MAHLIGVDNVAGEDDLGFRESIYLEKPMLS